MSRQVSLFSFFGSRTTRTPIIYSPLKKRQLTKKDHISITNVVKNLVDEVINTESRKRDDIFQLTSKKLENWKKAYYFWDTPDGKVSFYFEDRMFLH